MTGLNPLVRQGRKEKKIASARRCLLFSVRALHRVTSGRRKEEEEKRAANIDSPADWLIDRDAGAKPSSSHFFWCGYLPPAQLALFPSQLCQ